MSLLDVLLGLAKYGQATSRTALRLTAVRRKFVGRAAGAPLQLRSTATTTATRTGDRRAVVTLTSAGNPITGRTYPRDFPLDYVRDVSVRTTAQPVPLALRRVGTATTRRSGAATSSALVEVLAAGRAVAASTAVLGLRVVLEHVAAATRAGIVAVDLTVTSTAQATADRAGQAPSRMVVDTRAIVVATRRGTASSALNLHVGLQGHPARESSAVAALDVRAATAASGERVGAQTSALEMTATDASSRTALRAKLSALVLQLVANAAPVRVTVVRPSRPALVLGGTTSTVSSETTPLEPPVAARRGVAVSSFRVGATSEGTATRSGRGDAALLVQSGARADRTSRGAATTVVVLAVHHRPAGTRRSGAATAVLALAVTARAAVVHHATSRIVVAAAAVAAGDRVGATRARLRMRTPRMGHTQRGSRLVSGVRVWTYPRGESQRPGVARARLQLRTSIAAAGGRPGMVMARVLLGTDSYGYTRPARITNKPSLTPTAAGRVGRAANSSTPVRAATSRAPRFFDRRDP